MPISIMPKLRHWKGTDLQNSETNLSYQKLILEIDRQLRRLSDKSATELLAELMELQNKRDRGGCDQQFRYSDKSPHWMRETGRMPTMPMRNWRQNCGIGKTAGGLKAVGELSIDDIIAKIQAETPPIC